MEDTHDLKLLLETQLFEGETITVDSVGDVIEVDGKPLSGPKRMRKLANDHRHRIYFYGEPTKIARAATPTATAARPVILAVTATATCATKIGVAWIDGPRMTPNAPEAI